MAFKEIAYDMDRVSDELFDLVLSWKKETRRRQGLKTMSKKMTKVQWISDFIHYTLSRYQIESVQKELRVAAAFRQLAIDLAGSEHVNAGIFAKKCGEYIRMAERR